MDSENKEALARRAVACKGWRPLAGMADDECRIVHVDDDRSHRRITPRIAHEREQAPERRGVREIGAIESDRVHPVIHAPMKGDDVQIAIGPIVDPTITVDGHSLAEALVAALESAPC